jgi:hypothetical protein
MHAQVRQACLLASVVVLLAVALPATVLAQPADPSIGTWKLNLAKSRLGTVPAPKSSTFTIVAAGTGIKATVDSVAADGTVAHWGFTSNNDGKDNAITGNCPYGDVVATTLVDANTRKNVYKKGGTVTVTQVHVVSSDGKTDTITNTSTDAAGKTVTSVRVYDRQ